MSAMRSACLSASAASGSSLVPSPVGRQPAHAL
jgi:hypothetical protein